MTDYKHIYKRRRNAREIKREVRKGALAGILMLAALGIVGNTEQEVPRPEPVKPVLKSATQEKIERILPAHVAKPIAEKAAYPRTMAAIAHTESRGDHRAIGDKGKAVGCFQVHPRHWGAVPEDIEGQVAQANDIFMQLVDRHGYREAVKRWNGRGEKAEKYRKVVLAKVRSLE